MLEVPLVLPSRLHGVDPDEPRHGDGEDDAPADALRRIQKQQIKHKKSGGGRLIPVSQTRPWIFKPVVKEGPRSIPGEVSGRAV